MGFGLVRVGHCWSTRRRGWSGNGCGASASDPSQDWGLGFPSMREAIVEECEWARVSEKHAFLIS